MLRDVFALLLSAAVLSSCAELRWHKPGADIESLKQDLEQCRQTARVRAAREAWPFGLTTPQMVGVDRQGRTIVVQPYPRDTERFLLEHDLTRMCMNGKGYTLVPVEKDTAR